MSRNKSYIKQKKETFGQKFVNIIATIALACVINSQVCTAANNNLRIAQISDAHFSSFEENTSYKFLKKSPELLDDAIFQLNTSGPYNFVIFTGDLINKPIESELDKFIEHTHKLNYPWYAVDGNHDIAVGGTLTKNYFRKTLNKASSMNASKMYYAFTPKKGFRILCMDSIIDSRITTNGEYSSEQVAWLKSELYNHPKDVIIMCTHVPILEPYSSPSHTLLNADDVKKILKSTKNTIIVLQGHYHGTKIRQFDNVVYISCPSLVSYPNAFRVININSNNKRVLIDVFLKETNLKDIQNRAKLRLLGTEMLCGSEEDRNLSIEIKK